MGVLFGHRGHLLRVAGLFAAGVLAFLVLQAFLVPKGFGVYGHYRAGALEENRVRPPFITSGTSEWHSTHVARPAKATGRTRFSSSAPAR